jgi:hypothetical protein
MSEGNGFQPAINKARSKVHMFVSNRTPIGIRVNTTNETIVRVPVQRSGYAVVRYNGRYFQVRGGPNTRPYITGNDDDAQGRT